MNQDFAHATENALMDISGIAEFKNIQSTIPKFASKYWSLQWQIITISILLVVSTYLCIFY